MTKYYENKKAFNALEYNGNNLETIEEFVCANKNLEDKYDYYLALHGIKVVILRRGNNMFGVELEEGDWVWFDNGSLRKRTAEEMSKCSVAIDSVSVKFNVKTN